MYCFFQAEDGIRELVRSRGLGDVYKRQALMRAVVGPDLGVKASGGVRSYADAQKMVAAGATRIGTSAGIKIVQEAAGEAASAPGAESGY